MDLITDQIGAFSDWIRDNPSLSVLSAVGIFALKKIFGPLFGAIGKKHGEKFANRNAETEVADQIQDGSEQSPKAMTEEVPLPAMTPDELIEYYRRNEPPFQIQLSRKVWSFAATRIIDPISSGRISKQNIKFKYEPDLFVLDDELNSLTQYRLDEIRNKDTGKELFNGSPFRIKDLKYNDVFIQITVNRCKYFDSLRTNFSLDCALPTKNKTLREFLHGQSQSFEPFDLSRLPNHMGLVIMIETSDGQL